MIRAARRPLLIGWLALLAGCDYLYGVTRRADGPLTFDARVLQDVLRTQPGVHADHEWDGESMAFIIERPPAWVVVGCSTQWPPPSGEVFVHGPHRLNEVPCDDVLFASLALQQEIVEMLARTVPGFPSPSALQLEWNGLDFPLGDELAAAKARWETTAGKR